MRRGGGKAKGASFERDVCKQLSLWLSDGAVEDVFWRSAMSGGRSTVAHAKGKRLAAQAGDITCIHPIGVNMAQQFLMECKHYKSLNYAGLLKGSGHLCDFWAKTKVEAWRYGKHPFMIAKQNQCPITICLDRKGLDILNVKLKCTLVAPKQNLYILLFDNFLKHARRL